MRERTIDSFAGGGGASLGIAEGCGRQPDYAINHDAKAIATHAANHPKTRHFCQDVFRLKPEDVVGDLPVGLLWASPDCFPAGTLILTEAGYRPIEELIVGDKVLTHLGRWRAVTEIMKSRKGTIVIKGYGHPGLCVSVDHPFYVIHRHNAWDNSKRQYRPQFSEPDWVTAGELTALAGRDRTQSGHYWSSPISFESLPVPFIGGRGLPIDERLMWLAGRYVADGWIRLTKTRAEIVIVCGAAKLESTRERLSAWPRKGARSEENELAWAERWAGTAYQFAANHRGLAQWLLQEFGRLAHGKRLPGWVYGLPESMRRSLMEGYLSGDGCRRGKVIFASTVSKALAFGLRSLAASFGHSMTIGTGKSTGRVQERIVKTRTPFTLRWQESVASTHVETRVIGGHLYSPIRSITPGRVCDVYNLSVKQDESYIAEGLATHNCTHHSRAKGAKPVENKRRGLAWSTVHWVKKIRPRVICLENVREFENWGPLLPGWRCNDCNWLGTEGQAILARTRRRCPRCESLKLQVTKELVPDPERRGQTFQRWVARFRSLGYRVEWKSLNAADFGAPTQRHRLFLIARRDQDPIVWPQPTHTHRERAEAMGLKSWRAASECIDWSLPCLSIFDRKQPLAEATQRRIALGLVRYVLENPRPFIVSVNNEGSDESPSRVFDPAQDPLTTITGQGKHAIVTPVMIPIGYGERAGQAPRANDVQQPLGTVVRKEKHTLVAALLAKHYGGRIGASVEEPMPTIMTRNTQTQLVTAHLIHFNHGDKQWSGLEEPLRTITTGRHAALVYSFLLKWYGASIAQDLNEPLHTLSGKGKFGLVTVQVDGETYVIVDIGMRMLAPHELAKAQGFPADYILLGTKTDQIALIGNSVVPAVAAAVVRANYQPRNVRKRSCQSAR